MKRFLIDITKGIWIIPYLLGVIALFLLAIFWTDFLEIWN